MLSVLHDHFTSLGLRGPVLVLAAVASGWLAWRGRVAGALALRVVAALLALDGVRLQLLGLSHVDPAQRATRIAEGIHVVLVVPWFAGLGAMLFLPTVARAGRTRERIVIALLGAVFPLAQLPLRHAMSGKPAFGPWAAALAMTVAGGALLRRRMPEPGTLGAPLAYATFATLVSAASVPEVYLWHPHFAHHPDDLRFAVTCAALAMLAMPLGLLPLLKEARRTAQIGRAAWWGGVLALCALALSTLPSAFFVWRALMADTP